MHVSVVPGPEQRQSQTGARGSKLFRRSGTGWSGGVGGNRWWGTVLLGKFHLGSNWNHSRNRGSWERTLLREACPPIPRSLVPLFPPSAWTSPRSSRISRWEARAARGGATPFLPKTPRELGARFISASEGLSCTR
jgi:hypothetical protein